jgi:hypothetical protein
LAWAENAKGFTKKWLQKKKVVSKIENFSYKSGFYFGS